MLAACTGEAVPGWDRLLITYPQVCQNIYQFCVILLIKETYCTLFNSKAKAVVDNTVHVVEALGRLCAMQGRARFFIFL